MKRSSMKQSSTRTLRRIRLLVGFLAFALSLGVFAAPASAHTGEQSYLYLEVTDLALAGRVEFPLIDVEDVFGLDFIDEASDDDTLALADTKLDDLQAYAAEHLSIADVDGNPLTITFEGRDLLSTDKFDQDNNYLQLDFVLTGFDTPAPRQFIIGFDPFFDEIDGRDGLIVIANDVEGGVFNNEADFLMGFDGNNRVRQVDLGDASSLKNLTASVELGVDHIKDGPDHILFILVLVLPSVLLFKGGWHPTAGFLSSLWRILKIATMFTLAHSITFSLAGLDILPLPPSKFVEAIIAISIALAAIHNLRPLFPNKEWVIAFGFGLFHGMGFATLVEGLDVSRSTQLVSLLGRNIGIEIGQVAVIIAAFPALFLLRRTRYYLGVLWAGSLAMAVVALGWMIERVGEVDLGINDIVDPVFKIPNVLFYFAGLTVVAWILYQREAAAGRLLPVLTADEAVAEERVSTLTG